GGIARTCGINRDAGRPIVDVVAKQGVARNRFADQAAGRAAAVAVFVHFGWQTVRVVACSRLRSLSAGPRIGLCELGDGQSQRRAVAGISRPVVASVDCVEQRSSPGGTLVNLSLGLVSS